MKQAIGCIISALWLTAMLAGCSQKPAGESSGELSGGPSGAATEAVAENPVLDAKTVSPISPGELMQRIAENDSILILDVRTPDEYAESHLPGAINLPHTEISTRLSELPSDRSREIVVHCMTGRRADIAREILKNEAYTNVRELSGHFAEWSALDLPLEQGPAP